MKRILTGVLFSVACLGALQAAAQRPRWVESNRWAGHGTRTTELFRVNTSTWRLVYSINNQRSFRLSVHDAAGNRIASIRPLSGPDTERLIVRNAKPGEYYLKIQTVDADWSVAVHQYLSTIEEWQLLQDRQNPGPSLRRVAEYAGEGGAEQFTFDIDKPRWKLQWEFDEPGVFEFLIQTSDGEKTVYRTFLTKPGKYQSWMYEQGTFTLRIEAAETGAWNMSIAVPETRTGR